jgi:hypothetical protein
MMVMANARGTKSIPGDTGVTTKNMISVGIEDLPDKDRDDLEQELQRELEEVMAE